MYLKTDADVVEDMQITRKEVDLFTEILGLEKNMVILDLACGQGRHSLELARRGFKNVNGLDRSHYLIRKAKNICITEQIDALEIMGINSASYLILPKLIATLLFNPILTLIAIIVGIFGGGIAGTLSGVITMENFIYGIQYAFIPYYITYSLIKTVFFAFIITSVSAFQGYYVEGGSLEVGRASTKAVVYSSVFILLFNVILTQLLLS